MERLHMLDAEFLHLEDESSPMHIAGLSIFEGPPPSRDEMRRVLLAKLPSIPRYRRRVRLPLAELGRPVWVDDPHFDLDYHLRFTAVPTPGDAATLEALMGRLMSQRLDRSRPLWETWVVEGIAGGRWGLISKIHHSMVDGISGVDLTQAVLETDPNAPLPPPPPPWTPEPEPSRAALVLDAWRGLAGDLARLGRAVVTSAQRPAESAAKIAGFAAGIATFTGRLLALPWRTNPIQGTIGSHRGYALASASLADVQEIRKVLGGTVNDVILTAAASGYRALLAHQGQNPDSARIRSLVPVSVRLPSDRGTLGNQVSALLVDLPVHIADPLTRLHQVRAEVGWLKASHMAEAGAVFTQLGDLAPPMLVGALTRGVARAMHRLPQRSFSTVTTNVPGPRETLYCLGRRMIAWYPYVPITQGIRVGLAILSYNGGVGFGVTADPDSVHDAGVLARGIESGIAELLALARDARIAGAAPATQSVRAMA